MLAQALNWDKMSNQIKFPGCADYKLHPVPRSDGRWFVGERERATEANGIEERKEGAGTAGTAAIIMPDRYFQLPPVRVRAPAVSIITPLIGGVPLNAAQQLHLGLPERGIISHKRFNESNQEGAACSQLQVDRGNAICPPILRL